MNEATYHKISQYLNDELRTEERLAFELEMADDEALTSMVKLYNTIDTEMGNNEKYRADEIRLIKTLSGLNESYFKSKSGQPSIKQNRLRNKKTILLRWLPYSIAASVIIMAAIFFLRDPSPRQLAQNYISEDLSVLNLNMGSESDSLQAGILAYNNKNYDSALRVFTSYNSSHPGSGYIKKYIGLGYLATKKYDSAVKYFEELSDMKALYNNPGVFLKAVTLLERSNKEDEAQAKILLQQVVDKKLEGSKEAEEWLGKF